MERLIEAVSGPAGDNGILLLLVLGLVFKISGFAVRDELWLRLLVVSGFVCDAAYYFFRVQPVVPSLVSNLLLMAINFALILAIVTERTRWRMSPEDRRIYDHFQTLSPGQFRRLRRMIETRRVGPGSVLAREGQPVADLMLVLAERIVISKGGRDFPIAGPAFVGEIAFLTGHASSADVTLPEGGTVLGLDSVALHRRMARKPALRNAMVALFGTELARKVAASVPMARAAEASPLDPGVEAALAGTLRPAGEP